LNEFLEKVNEIVGEQLKKWNVKRYLIKSINNGI
jgi:hypothetical protein